MVAAWDEVSGGTAEIAGGRGGDVLLVWSDVETEAGHPGRINAMLSRNHGGSFAPEVVAVSDASRFTFGSLDVKVGKEETAHVVYERQPRSKGDDADIGYIWSARPYRTWSAAVTLNDETAHTQSSPSLTTQTCGMSTVLQVAWSDARLPPAADPERSCDVFYTRKLARRGSAWSPNLRASDASSFKSAGSCDVSP